LKKLLAISLAVVYLAISSGVVVNIHYCMGEIAEVVLGHKSSDTCGKCGMENKGCCHDDVKVVKIQDSQSVASINTHFAKAEAQAPAYHELSYAATVLPVSIIVQTAHAPPGKAEVPLHIRNCVFRI
jgi:uncharacterized protein YfcZ (UPF0381/DUF406 family)